ncbi:MAG: FAD binding domain-containing protein [Pseudomonadota bacterium]
MLEVVTTATLAEAAAAMGPGARFLGGGTLVMRAANEGDPTLRRIVRSTERLDRIQTEGNRIRIGAGVTMSGLLAARETAFLAPAARAVGGPQVRNQATVGGNLHAPHPYGDLTVALLALDGIVHLSNGQDMALEPYLAARAHPPGLVAAVSVTQPMGEAFRFRKVSRIKPKGVSVLSMAAHLSRSAGRLSGVRIAYGAMGPAPVRAAAVERALEGADLSATGIASALAQATVGLEPPDDALASAWYRREVAPVHLRRLLLGEP